MPIRYKKPCETVRISLVGDWDKKINDFSFFEKTHALLPEETPGFGINLGTGGWMITDTPQKLIGI